MTRSVDPVPEVPGRRVSKGVRSPVVARLALLSLSGDDVEIG